MRRILFTFAVISSMAVTSSAFAAQTNSARQSVGAARKGPVAKLVELERRKNEWLRQRFGR